MKDIREMTLDELKALEPMILAGGSAASTVPANCLM